MQKPPIYLDSMLLHVPSKWLCAYMIILHEMHATQINMHLLNYHILKKIHRQQKKKNFMYIIYNINTCYKTCFMKLGIEYVFEGIELFIQNQTFCQLLLILMSNARCYYFLWNTKREILHTALFIQQSSQISFSLSCYSSYQLLQSFVWYF